MLRSYAWSLGGLLGLSLAWACGDAGGDGQEECLVGSRFCMCTAGGACDPGLSCIDGICVMVGDTDPGTNTTPGTEESESESMSASMSASGTQGSQTSADTSASETDPTTMTATDDGPLLDVGNDDPLSGCTKMDMLFVLDSSASMAPERQALAATDAFTEIIDVIEQINGGGVDYRIGVSDDKDGGFEVPPGWVGANPWFDSNELDQLQMAQSFNGAVASISGEPPFGCEHVLTSGIDLLLGDPTGFVREDALLVLVLLTDVDDYGDYDQPDGNICGVGCGTPPVYTPDQAEETLRTTIKGDLEGAVAAIVIAGDPTMTDPTGSICQQPGVCGCDGVDCNAYHGTKLYAFAELLGANGYTANVCNANVPMSVETALTDNVNLACMNFEPEG